MERLAFPLSGFAALLVVFAAGAQPARVVTDGYGDYLLVLVQLSPHLPASTDEVPNLLHGPMRHSDRSAVRRELEVSEASGA